MSLVASPSAPLSPERSLPASRTVRAYCEQSACERATWVRKAKLMLACEREGVFRNGVHSGPGHFAERHGSSAEAGRMELDLGHALETNEGLEAEVLDGTVPPAAAAVLGRVAREGLTDSGDDWRELARTVGTRALLRLFLRRRDEKLAGESVFTVIAHVTLAGLEDLAWCREWVSRRIQRPASTGVTIAVMAAECRRRNDPLRRRPGTRRRPDTTGTRDRYVPAEADREVRERSSSACRFPLCEHAIWVDRAHGVPHREGGGREAVNLHLLCKRHHRHFDAGHFRIEGTAGEPRFVLPDGTPLEGRVRYRSGDDPGLAADERAALEALLAGRVAGDGSAGRAAPRAKDRGPPRRAPVRRRRSERRPQG